MYVDGFVLPLPKKNLAAYKKIAGSAGKLWIEHGALAYHECVGDDIASVAEHGMVRFDTLAGLKKDEVVIFAFITYASKAQRDKVNKKVMADPRLKCDPNNMPFDCNRMAYGGFEGLVSYAASAAKPAKAKAAKPVKKPAVKLATKRAK
jgi:uncharacterized protein YbaA (DUF1428 family)